MTAPRRYIFHIRRRINQLPDFFRLPLQDAGTFTLPVFTQKIVHRTGAPAATPWMEFNNHHPALFPVRHAATVPDRHRSPSALPRSAPGHDRHHRRSLSGRSGSGYCPCRQADAAAPAKSREACRRVSVSVGFSSRQVWRIHAASCFPSHRSSNRRCSSSVTHIVSILLRLSARIAS